MSCDSFFLLKISDATTETILEQKEVFVARETPLPYKFTISELYKNDIKICLKKQEITRVTYINLETNLLVDVLQSKETQDTVVAQRSGNLPSTI